MANNPHANKIIYYGETKIDLTGITVAPENLLQGYTALDKSGALITGTAIAGSGMNTQVYAGTGSSTSTAYSSTGVSLTVEKTGTYTVMWTGWRTSSSGTSGSQLYRNNSSYGSANTTFTGTYGQNITLTNVSLSAGDTIEVRARVGGTFQFMYVSNLIIEQTA